MKNSSEPTGRIWDIVLGVLLVTVAVGVWIGVYLALYFAINILEGL